MSDSVFDYKKYIELVVRRKELFLKLALLIMTGAIILSYVLPKKYEASSTVFIEKNVINELVKGITVTPSMEDTIKVLTYAITSRTLLNKAADSLDMNVTKKDGTEMDGFYKKLQKNTEVRVKGNNLFTISYTDGDPRMARDFTNTLVRLYIEESTSSKRGESYGATKFLSEQIDSFRQKLEKADQDLNEFKREKGGVIAVDEAKLFEEINVSQQKLYDLELRRRQLEGMRKVTRKSSDPLQTRMAALQRRLDELRVQYTDSYPEIIQIKSDMETIRTQLKTRGATYQPLDPQEIDKIESEIAALKASEASLRRYISTNQGLLRSLPSAKAQLERLEAEKVNQKNIYDQLYARHGQSEVSKQMEVQDKSTTFRIVDPAIMPQRPVSPNRLMIMLLGMVGGVAGSFGILYLIDQMDDTVRDVDFIKGLGVPLLAVISRIRIQREIDLQRRRTRRVCTYAGLYFLFLLCFPLSELMGLTFMDSLVDYLKPANIVQNVKDQVR
jgi:polysaccharide chain length determinant protein (PEP-CTERM system associated)